MASCNAIELSNPIRTSNSVTNPVPAISSSPKAIGVPAAAPAPLEPFSYSYRLTACLDDARLSPNGRAVNTFTAPSRALGSAEKDAPGTRRFMVDFASGDLAYYAADPSQVEVV